ncbi:GFA family protein [Marinobacter halodurans]|uniref:GFA family protein n=2 Tax=Marinobacter halodurans TaxID=2528979 RepID=A0ABY1ZPW9_9GAMM|nr:GFA family protein [Marinobacter halodurans]
MKGQCLCGAVTIETSRRERVDVCHCGMCRRWSGGPMLAVHCGPDVRITGLDSVTVYTSSDWAERGFCSRCGTHLFYKFKGSGQYAMPAGFFQAGADFAMGSQIFIDRKPGYYDFANQTPMLTETEVMERYVTK